MTTSDYTKAAAEIRSAYTDYRRFMGAWLVATSRWKAENLELYKWTLPEGTFILPPGKALYVGKCCSLDGANKTTLQADMWNPFRPWPEPPPYDWSQGHSIKLFGERTSDTREGV